MKFKKLKIQRLIPGSDAWVIADLYNKQPLLLVVNDAYTANRLVDEIQLFKPELNIAIFQDTEILPYERISTQKDIIANRLKVLWQISLKQLDVVIIQLSTLQTKLCPKEYLYSRVMLLKIGDKIATDALRHKLVNSDYTLVEQVYESGEFAIRGGIIDIMPMGSKQLVRIELFDDEIESLKLLDYKTKQLLEEIKEYELIPAREYPTDKESLKTFLNNFGHHFPKTNYPGLFKELSNGILPSGSEFYLPLFFNSTSTLFDYLDDGWQIIYFQSAIKHLNLNWQEINKRYALFNYQYPCLKPTELFLTADNIFSNINQHNSIEIAEEGNLSPKVESLPDLSVNNKVTDPLANLKAFRTNFKGKIYFVLDSIGRIEIMRHTLNNHLIKAEKISNLTEAIDNKIIYLLEATLYNGFITDNQAYITEQELYKFKKPISRRKKSTENRMVENDAIIRDLAEIEVGDYVVHINHGIAKYLGLTRQVIANIEYEMLELEYQNESTLFIPVHNLHLISRYSKLDNVNVSVNKLGSKDWDKVKNKAEKKINDMAAELLELYAKREMQQGNKFTLPEEYAEFAESFMHQPTVDQLSAINGIIDDMISIKPMDRLVCGDVGFGKTEVAIRAAFICAMNGKQVAMLAPTTLLTEQHYQNFVNRFAGFPIKIAEISRFKTKKEVTETLELVKQGQIDILIGTHRLIQSDIQFPNLGLVIIDEEHRFGVKQKEKLKQMRANVDFLTLTATPIPRTLSMAMEGLRDFSIIATPPKRRLAVNTLIVQDDNQIIREAILREIRRGGQVYFLFNDVENISKMHERLSNLVPEIEIAIAHGQMNENVLEHAIRDFIKQRFHILLCSTIIESGIDIANANTIIIYRADKLGLAQLHQLRGRVGRSHHQAYCYLVIPENITSDAEKRLDAISMTTELGSGFNLAMHDLEIRGAGEILGESQSGDIREVGLSLYTEMLKKAINKLKHNKLYGEGAVLQDVYCEVNLNTTAIIPDDFCPDIHERLVYYKRLAKAETKDAVDSVYQDIMDNWGLPPDELKTLIEAHYIRVKAVKLGVQKIDISDRQIVLTFIDKAPIDPTKIVALLQKLFTCKFDGKNKLIWGITSTTINDKIINANSIVNQLS